MSVELEIVGDIRGRLVPGLATLTDNEYGIDILTRSYTALTDEVYGLLPARGEVDRFLENFVVVNRVVKEQRGRLSSVDVICKGLVGDVLPQPEVEGGWEEATASVTTTKSRGPVRLGPVILGESKEVDGQDDLEIITPDLTQGDISPTVRRIADEEETGEVTLTYHSPQTTFLYVTREMPKEPRYRGKLIAGANDWEIVDTQPSAYTGRPIFIRQIRTVAFRVKKAGAYWEVSEVNKGLIVSRRAYYTRRVKFGVSSPLSVHNLR